MDLENGTDKNTQIGVFMPEVMTFNETKYYLKISRATLYKLLQNGTIPGFKADKKWRVDKEGLEKWMLDNENMNQK